MGYRMVFKSFAYKACGHVASPTPTPSSILIDRLLLCTNWDTKVLSCADNLPDQNMAEWMVLYTMGSSASG